MFHIKQLTIAIVASMIMLCACTNKSSKITEAHDERTTFITEFLTHYPHATLQDIYKGEFQDQFGPSHLITNREAVKNYIIRELSLADTLGGTYCEPCGWQGRYWRVNLSVIRDCLLTTDEFVDAFIASSPDTIPILSQAWLEEWSCMQRLTHKLYPQLKDYAADSANIARLHSENNYVMHHSRAFNTHHHPHYRIMRRDIVEQIILPAITAATQR
jgi:hypothetical protein